jgi:hypothetical protein
MSRPLEAEDTDKLAAAALPPLTTLTEEQIHGWCGHRHTQDRNITEESTKLGGIHLFQLVQAQRKVHASLLQSECAMEEQAVMQVERLEYLNQQRRSQIKQHVKARLAPEVSPTLRSIEVAISCGILYATATSDRQIDAFMLSFMQTTGISATPLDPEALAQHLLKVDIFSFPPKSFSFAVADTATDIIAGREFLTWLWYCSEKRGGLHRSEQCGEFAFMIEGPLDFMMEGRGAHETIMKKGEPLLAAETKAALVAGKTLKSARLTFARGEEIWSCKLEADSFAFKGMKLPQTERFDRVGKFQERIKHIDTFRTLFCELYHQYLNERTEHWDVVSNEIKHWVHERPVQS